MRARRSLSFVVMMFVLALQVQAGGKGAIQQYFSDAAGKVKATDNPSEKRSLLNTSLQTMSKALDEVQGLHSISQDDAAGIARFKSMIQEKQDELAGTNGFVGVPDEQLNAFSDYVVQDMEQADGVITISIVTLLLIIILIVLLVK